jgi:D-aminopeptidase
LLRLAKRAVMGLARTGSNAHFSSGDFVLAFSTVPRLRTDASTHTTTLLSDEAADPLFEAAADATEAAIVYALLAGETTTGRAGHVAEALPLDRLREVMKAHGRPLR